MDKREAEELARVLAGRKRFACIARVRYREGRCYELAGKVMNSDEGKDLILVHGTALNLLGDRHEHAWLELPNGETWCPVSGRPVKGPIPEKRYTQSDFRAVAIPLGHWGPWP